MARHDTGKGNPVAGLTRTSRLSRPGQTCVPSRTGEWGRHAAGPARTRGEVLRLAARFASGTPTVTALVIAECGPAWHRGCRPGRLASAATSAPRDEGSGGRADHRVPKSPPSGVQRP